MTKNRIKVLFCRFEQVLGLADMLDVLKSNIRLFEKAFCPSTFLDWTQEEFVECFMPEFSEEESNKKGTEVNTYNLSLILSRLFLGGDTFILWLYLTFVLSVLVFA